MHTDTRDTDSHRPDITSFGRHSNPTEGSLKIQEKAGAIEVEVRGEPALLHFGQTTDSLDAMHSVIDPLLAARFPLTRQGMPYDEATMIPGTRITISDYNSPLSQPLKDLQLTTAALESMEGVYTALASLEDGKGRREHLIGIVVRSMGSNQEIGRDLQNCKYDEVRERIDQANQQIEQRLERIRDNLTDTVETYFRQFESTELLYEKAKGVDDS